MELRNHAKERLLAGDVVLCMATRIARSVDTAMIAKAAGFDAIYVDMEHSAIGVETASTLCASALGLGITPLVRTPGHAHHLAARLLDSGALGIIYPRVTNAIEAQDLVAACKFPPVGRRSVSGAGPSNLYRSRALGDVNKAGNELTLCTAMLETPDAIANADEIAAVSGLDVLLIGSNDLSSEMGIPGQVGDARIRTAYATVADACRKHGKALGVGGVRNDAKLLRELVSIGARFIIAGSDSGYLATAAKRDVDEILTTLKVSG